jgi:alpha-tubulin suppressor-like RCC1 family protein
VIAVGNNGYGQCNVGNWTDIEQVATGYSHTVGLRTDGTVVAVGTNEIGQCNVGDWVDIVQVAAGWGHTVGLKANGTVVGTGYYDYGQTDVSGWTDIVRVAAGGGHTVGIRADGTVVSVGLNDDRQCDNGDWTDVRSVAAGNFHTVGLRNDGTVVAAGVEVELARWNLGDTALYLTISSTTGGEVTGPGQGTFPCYPDRRLNLMAKPENDYRFVRWAGDVGTIANVNAAQTTITMDGDYSITANFEEKQPVNWALIGGIIGAAVIVGAVIFFARRKRATSASGR